MMYKPFLTILLFILSVITAFSQNKRKQRIIDSIAIRNCVLDYIEGLYEMNPERVSRSSHVRLMKTNVWRPSGNDSFRLSPMGHTQLVEMAGSLNRNGRYRQDARKEIITYDIGKRTASVNLVAQEWFDYMHLAKIKGEWKIINILYEMGELPADKAFSVNIEQLPEASAVRQCVLGYIQGMQEQNPDKIGRSTHQRMVKRSINTTTGADTLVYETQYDLLKKAGAVRPVNQRKTKFNDKVIIYDIANRSASVKLNTKGRIEYLHLGNLNGQWKVVNVIWE